MDRLVNFFGLPSEELWKKADIVKVDPFTSEERTLSTSFVRMAFELRDSKGGEVGKACGGNFDIMKLWEYYGVIGKLRKSFKFEGKTKEKIQRLEKELPELVAYFIRELVGVGKEKIDLIRFNNILTGGFKGDYKNPYAKDRPCQGVDLFCGDVC